MTDTEFQLAILDYLAKQREYVDVRSLVTTELNRRWPTNAWVELTTRNDTRFCAVQNARLDSSARVWVTVTFVASVFDDCLVTRGYHAECLRRLPAAEVPAEIRRRVLAYRWSGWRTSPFFHCDTNINLAKV